MSNMEEMDNIIHLTDEEGNDCPFEFVDLINYEGEDYVVLLPLDEEDTEVVILRVDSEDPDAEEDTFSGVEDESILEAVFGIFKEKFKDEFNFG